jgi:hypothetical protein
MARATFPCGKRPELSRRDMLKLAAAGAVGCSMSGWLEALAQQTAGDPKRRKSVILLWMNGGPSQMDTFDLKPGHPNGGPFKDIQTSVPGIRISEHLPRLARNMHDMAIIRSMSTREGDHARHVLPAHRLSAPRPDPIPDPRFAAFQGTGPRRPSAAKFRQHRALSILQSGGVGPWILGTTIRSLAGCR